jgi:hypothetical protein
MRGFDGGETNAPRKKPNKNPALRKKVSRAAQARA